MWESFKTWLILFAGVMCLVTVTPAYSEVGQDWQALPTGSIQRIAFGSCAKHWQSQPIWKGIIGTQPDLFIFLGDNVYADTDGKTAWKVSKAQLVGEWNRLADKSDFQKARTTFPFLATWDNHDYGSHAGGAEFLMKEESKEVFLQFFGEPKTSPRWERSGIYDAKIIGPVGQRVQIILLDTKYNRSRYKKNPTPKAERLKTDVTRNYLPDETPAKTHLGAEQWKWLEAELQKPAELRFLCSSIQVIPDQKGMDEWANFPHERRRLIDLVGKTNGVILLSGNVHFAEVSRLPRNGASPLTELTSSGMTHINEAYGKAPNQFRLGEPFIDLNFGLVEVNWERREVSLSACGINGRKALTQIVKLDDLKPRRAE